MKRIKRALALVALFLVSATAVASETQKVQNFSFKDIDGKAHQFSEYRGKWVIVNYWATFCGPCVAEIPALNSVAKRFKDNAVVLGMEAGETPTDELKQFMAQKKIAYPVIPTQDSTMFALGLVYGVPTTFVVNPQGEIVDTHMGAITSAMLQNYLRADSNNPTTIAGDKEDCVSGFC
ncbi:TlpA family protein disulfide reductase [Thiothrix subterranea]|uniref:TlpA family protein disulfide reductase n=1 Tax=Thiothrix subterranea TaxID=2735563 RepID=UPI00192BE207|nr:TlpA disulfide reductase family protein [Thiothrix subterranea]QQZ28518.1 TlpA family protein disulfide reductase [Thiothrix subterranea]